MNVEEKAKLEAVKRCLAALSPTALDSHPTNAHIHYAKRARAAVRRAFPELTAWLMEVEA